MEKLLLIVVVLYVVWRVLHSQGRHLLRTSRGADDFGRLSRDPRRRRDEEPAHGGRLVVCDRCGVVVPEAATVIASGGGRLCESCAGEPAREG